MKDMNFGFRLGSSLCSQGIYVICSTNITLLPVIILGYVYSIYYFGLHLFLVRSELNSKYWSTKDFSLTFKLF
jgi:hypothetical protein